jgi:hypothetical protein
VGWKENWHFIDMGVPMGIVVEIMVGKIKDAFLNR